MSQAATQSHAQTHAHTHAHVATPRQKELLGRLAQGRVLGEFIFDVHTHTCDGWSMGSLYDGSSEGLQREMQMLGFSGMACSAVCAISGVDFERANDSLLRDIRKAGNRITAYVGIDIRHGKTLVGDVENYLKNGFSGGKLYTRWGVPYDDARYDPVLEMLNARKMPCLAHCWGGGDVKTLAGAARKFPHVNFIAAHTGSADLDVYVENARTLDNLYIDTAYSRGPRGLIEEVVRRMGSTKLLFGSDAALFSAAQQVGRVIAARISDEDRRNILGLNAARLFGVKPTPAV
ncbi:MAG: amidohydrolase family protein [Planctomycetota bacterium]|nr:amidohydrolase family protein [Planctomycetota bacterium]